MIPGQWKDFNERKYLLDCISVNFSRFLPGDVCTVGYGLGRKANIKHAFLGGFKNDGGLHVILPGIVEQIDEDVGVKEYSHFERR